MMAASVTNLRSVSSNNQSINAFQIADSGSQAVTKELKVAADGDRLSNIIVDGDSCDNSTNSIDKDPFLGGKYRVTFFDSSDPPVQLNCNADVSAVASVKSVGTYGDTARAVQVAVAQSIKPIGWWKFNNNADDETSGASDGTLSGVPLPTFVNAPTIANRALKIDGGSGVVTIANESNFDLRRTVSISLWFRANSLPPSSSAPLVSKMDDIGNTNSRAYSVWLNGLGFVHLASWNTVAATQSCTDTEDIISSGTWYHYVGVIDRDGGVVKIYVDGSEVTPGSTAHHCVGGGSVEAEDAAQNDEPIRIGGSFGAFSTFDGQIDDVRIYDGLLSLSEVTALYNGGNGRE